MNIPADFPADIKTKFSTLDKAIKENQAVSTALKQQLSADDYRKALSTVGVDSLKNTMGITTTAPTPDQQSFFQKNKTYIIIGVVIVVVTIVFFVIKRRK